MDADVSNEPSVRNPRFSWIGLIGALFVVALLIVALLPAIQSPRTPDRGNQCRNYMKQLSLALQSYHDAWRSFPPACTYDKSGKPMHSWRVLILRFLENATIYKKYDMKQLWNSPHNWKVIQEVDWGMFHCPSGKGGPGETNYVAVIGDETTWWPAGKGLRMRDIKDSTSQTILLVEVADSGIHWAEPRDLPLAQAVQGVNPPHVKFSISSGHVVEGAHVAFCDSHVEFLPSSTSKELLRALLTRAGGEPLMRDDLGDLILAPTANP
jgi:prepilin-type processing-associated H-X9-DG protein